MLCAFQDKQPILAENSFLAPGAYVIGDVIIGEQSSICMVVFYGVMSIQSELVAC